MDEQELYNFKRELQRITYNVEKITYQLHRTILVIYFNRACAVQHVILIKNRLKDLGFQMIAFDLDTNTLSAWTPLKNE